MKVLILGANGQLGRALVHTSTGECTVVALTRSQLDIGDGASLAACIATERPAVVINAAAYTAVDRAESNEAQAFAINAVAVADLANCCAKANVRLIHISTDYVFDGNSVAAYDPNAATNPINVYGASKLAGERVIADTPTLEWTVVRTSWVYSAWGTNFLLTMLRLMRERGEVSVVSDQIGSPTSALTLAKFLWRICRLPKGMHMLHFTDAGVASWYDFAIAINEEAVRIGALHQPAIVKPITTAEFPTVAKRPAQSLLSTRSSLAAVPFTQMHWRHALREVLEGVPHG